MSRGFEHMTRQGAVPTQSWPGNRTRSMTPRPSGARCATCRSGDEAGRLRWQMFGGMLLATALAMALVPSARAQEQREVNFISAQGEEIGTAVLTGTTAGLLIELDLQGLPPDSWHGLHIHENGACDADEGFKSAGDHFAVSGTEHGFLVEGGPHSGDMPNQYVSADGTLKAHVLNGHAFLGGDVGNVSGTAIILHAGPDDYQSQPSGDAGDRIACAVID